ncbi:hypothetical protein [Crocosphaera chwakensis]|uniref:Uncharacterized protein n=1 Tax=Crocosphaera chwakensis CCY0110 TaxID=391612 RepID=A3IY63_9CHRO|nr:hypothetical protein [Crocosphaera chwakensis]EAZ88584.1 hypothetical protein CY0110_21490 [Crocosphaera chwakensis CCY0110]
MRRKISHIVLISISLLTLSPVPTFAQTTTSQTGSIEGTVNGDNNQVYQTINQTIINHPGKGSIQRNQGNNQKNPQKSSHSTSHRHSSDREHPRYNDRD